MTSNYGLQAPSARQSAIKTSRVITSFPSSFFIMRDLSKMYLLMQVLSNYFANLHLRKILPGDVCIFICMYVTISLSCFMQLSGFPRKLLHKLFILIGVYNNCSLIDMTILCKNACK